MQPAGSTVPPTLPATFGEMLKYVRRRARLTQRELAIAVGYSEAHLCRLEQNQRLPDLTTLLALFVPTLDLDDAPELTARLLDLAAAARDARSAEREDAAQRPGDERPKNSALVPLFTCSVCSAISSPSRATRPDEP